MINKSSYEELLLNMDSAKDKHGVRERFAKESFFFAKNCRLQIKEFGSTAIYICVCVYVYFYNYIVYIYIYIFHYAYIDTYLTILLLLYIYILFVLCLVAASEPENSSAP